jgi:hypothetical protein
MKENKMQNEYSNELIVALAKAFAKKLVDQAKGDLPVGGFDVNALVRVQGHGNKGKDSSMLSWSKTKYDVLSMLSMSAHNEETQEKILGQYKEILAKFEDPAQKEQAAKDVRKRVEKVNDKVKNLIGQSEVFRTGTVTFNGTVEVVEEADTE